MKKFGIRLLFLLFAPTLFVVPVSAQIKPTLQQIKTQQIKVMSAMEAISYPAKTTRVHNFYINKNWQNSFVINLSGEILYFNGRYNVLSKTIEFIQGGKERVIYPRKIKAAVVGEKVLIPISAQQIQQVDNNRYVEVLSSGNLHLLNSYILDTRLDSGSSISFEGTGKKTYFVDEVLYYTTDFKNIQKLPKSKNKILDVFIGNKESVAAFAKTNQLRFNTKEDLILLFDYYNRILGQ